MRITRRAPAVTTQGEGGSGQAEINFPARAPVPAADGHTLFKHAAKVIAHQQSRAVTFMALPDQVQASSGCHLNVSLRDAAGRLCTAGAGATGLSERAHRFLAGVLAFSPELTLLHAPLPNSYRRLQPGGWAPSAATWAIQRFEESKLASHAFGDNIRDHVAGMARHQLRLARHAVTDWELEHGFETA
jgi:glutamine synthetase